MQYSVLYADKLLSLEMLHKLSKQYLSGLLVSLLPCIDSKDDQAVPAQRCFIFVGPPVQIVLYSKFNPETNNNWGLISVKLIKLSSLCNMVYLVILNVYIYDSVRCNKYMLLFILYNLKMINYGKYICIPIKQLK